jgi:hypothetical protein
MGSEHPASNRQKASNSKSGAETIRDIVDGKVMTGSGLTTGDSIGFRRLLSKPTLFS